jgi:hypothetical protein
VSYYRPDDAEACEEVCSRIMYDCGAFSFWKQARRKKREWEEAERDWRPYYAWLEARLWWPGRWAVIPDRIAAPTQLNDALLTDWPHGKDRGAPVWHMDEPVERLGRLRDAGYARICFGWVGTFDPNLGDICKDEREVGCPAYQRKMEEVDAFFRGDWPPVHQFRGAAVAGDYPGVLSTDVTSLAQNGHRHDWKDDQHDVFSPYPAGRWVGRKLYADRLERLAA